MMSNMYDHVNTLLEHTSAMYDIISDRLALQSAGYGAAYYGDPDNELK